MFYHFLLWTLKSLPYIFIKETGVQSAKYVILAMQMFPIAVTCGNTFVLKPCETHPGMFCSESIFLLLVNVIYEIPTSTEMNFFPINFYCNQIHFSLLVSYIWKKVRIRDKLSNVIHYRGFGNSDIWMLLATKISTRVHFDSDETWHTSCRNPSVWCYKLYIDFGLVLLAFWQSTLVQGLFSVVFLIIL